MGLPHKNIRPLEASRNIQHNRKFTWNNARENPMFVRWIGFYDHIKRTREISEHFKGTLGYDGVCSSSFICEELHLIKVDDFSLD
jgi:hypothetical protein